MTLTEYAGQWLTTCALHLRHSTVLTYTRAFHRDLLPVFGAAQLEDLTRGRIRALLLARAQGGATNDVLRHIFVPLQSCLQSAVDEGLLDDNPARGAARKLIRFSITRGGVRSMSREQLQTFLATAPVVVPHFADLFTLLAHTGLRIGEALGLTAAQVDLERRQLHVTHQWNRYDGVAPPKAGSARAVDLSQAAADLLRRRITALAGRSRWLFPGRGGAKPLHPAAVQKAMRRVLAAAGLPARFTPHSLRHSWAVVVLEESGDLTYASRQLGHSTVSITADLYGKAARPRRLDAVDRLSEVVTRPHTPRPAALEQPHSPRQE